jgi:predicted HTH domain antitoxin
MFCGREVCSKRHDEKRDKRLCSPWEPADKGFTEARMDIAVDRYVEEMTSLEQSATLAGVSFWRFLDEVRRRNVQLRYSMADAESEIDRLLARKK